MNMEEKEEIKIINNSDNNEEERLLIKNIRKCKWKVFGDRLVFHVLIGLTLGSFGMGIYVISEIIKGKNISESGSLFSDIVLVLLMFATAACGHIELFNTDEKLCNEVRELRSYENKLMEREIQKSID